MKIITVVGARPQFIKLAPLSKLLNQYHEEIVIHTGQHYDKGMSDNFFEELGIVNPKYNLRINNGSHGEQSGRMLIELEKVIIKESPNIVIVFGDTNTTMAGAIVASKLHIPIYHIEAGLRSFNKLMPEEINRIITDHVSDYLFAPTLTAFNNLTTENLASKSYLVGDIMVDSLNYAITRTEGTNYIKKYGIIPRDYYLVTLHRPYNVDDPLKLSKILSQIGKLSLKVIFPVHPRTHKIIIDNSIELNPNILLIPPVGYFEFIQLQSSAYKVITDSGGIQKEAYILKIPCITLRTETEWVETVQSGWNCLINTYEEDEYYKRIESFRVPQSYENIFGENVTKKMIEIINR